jgi:hypothetical protein
VYRALQFFGEMSALLDAGQGRVALSFHANTFCSIVHLDRALLRRLLVGHPRIELRLKQARLPCDSVHSLRRSRPAAAAKKAWLSACCEARAFEREPRRASLPGTDRAGLPGTDRATAQVARSRSLMHVFSVRWPAYTDEELRPLFALAGTAAAPSCAELAKHTTNVGGARRSGLAVLFVVRRAESSLVSSGGIAHDLCRHEQRRRAQSAPGRSAPARCGR